MEGGMMGWGERREESRTPGVTPFLPFRHSGCSTLFIHLFWVCRSLLNQRREEGQKSFCAQVHNPVLPACNSLSGHLWRALFLFPLPLLLLAFADLPVCQPCLAVSAYVHKPNVLFWPTSNTSPSNPPDHILWEHARSFRLSYFFFCLLSIERVAKVHMGDSNRTFAGWKVGRWWWWWYK